MKIAVVGTGYVGLVTGTCFAETGNTAVCVDVDIRAVRIFNTYGPNMNPDARSNNLALRCTTYEKTR